MQNNTKQIAKTLVVTTLYYFACSIILLSPALYNGYPLINPDTGSNIFSAYNFHVPIDRPISYGILIRITTLVIHSLWMIVLLQTFVLVFMLDRVSKKLLGSAYSRKIFIMLIMLLAFFTSCSWHTSHILPDIFTSITILAIADFLLQQEVSKRDIALYFIGIWIFIEQHNSNLLIALIISVSLLIYSRLKQNKLLVKKSFFLLILTLFSFVSISFFNLWEGNKFRPSASSHVFMMARMAENGILDQFLSEYCPTEHYSICNYQGKTGNRQWDFMWVEGHLLDNGGYDRGWIVTEQEYKQIVFKSLTTPKYLLKHIYESVEGTFRQLIQITVSIMQQGEGSSPYNQIQNYYPYELKEFKTALQASGELTKQMNFFNALIFLFFIITVVLAILKFSRENHPQTSIQILNLIILGVVCNAFVTSTFSTVTDRLQSRVSWLIPYLCLLLLIRAFNAHNKIVKP